MHINCPSCGAQNALTHPGFAHVLDLKRRGASMAIVCCLNCDHRIFVNPQSLCLSEPAAKSQQIRPTGMDMGL